MNELKKLLECSNNHYLGKQKNEISCYSQCENLKNFDGQVEKECQQ